MDLKTIDKYLANPNVHKVLDTIGYTEGTDKRHGYNTIVGGKRFDNVSQHPNIIGLRTKEGNSTAAGRYQITKTTWDDVAPKLGLKEFTPQNQDRVAVYLMNRRGALNHVVKGEFGHAINKLGNEWVSLPSGTSSQNKHSWADVGKVLNTGTQYSANKNIYSPVEGKSNKYAANNYLTNNLSSSVNLTPNIMPNQAQVLTLNNIATKQATLGNNNAGQSNSKTHNNLASVIDSSNKSRTPSNIQLIAKQRLIQNALQNRNNVFDFNSPNRIIQDTNPYLGLAIPDISNS